MTTRSEWLQRRASCKNLSARLAALSKRVEADCPEMSKELARYALGLVGAAALFDKLADDARKR